MFQIQTYAKTTTQDTMTDQIATFLTFQDYNAEAAMNFYVSLFDNSKVLEINQAR